VVEVEVGVKLAACVGVTIGVGAGGADGATGVVDAKRAIRGVRVTFH